MSFSFHKTTMYFRASRIVEFSLSYNYYVFQSEQNRWVFPLIKQLCISERAESLSFSFSKTTMYVFQSEQNDVPGPLHPEYPSHPEGKKISLSSCGCTDIKKIIFGVFSSKIWILGLDQWHVDRVLSPIWENVLVFFMWKIKQILINHLMPPLTTTKEELKNYLVILVQ